jgi:hypothetical protein
VHFVIHSCAQERKEHDTQELHEQGDRKGLAGDWLVVCEASTAGVNSAARHESSSAGNRGVSSSCTPWIRDCQLVAKQTTVPSKIMSKSLNATLFTRPTGIDSWSAEQ